MAGDRGLATLIIASYHRLLRSRLAPEGLTGDEAADWLYEDAPFGLLAHDGAADPRFTFANKTAQRCFEYGWDEFIGLPSRLSAEASNREERQRLLDEVSRQGYAAGYSGRRISRSGRRFWIEDVTMWQFRDDRSGSCGQAAMIPRWRDDPEASGA